MLSVQLLHFKKKKNAEEDKKFLEEVTSYPVQSWRDKGFLQLAELDTTPDDDAIFAMGKVVRNVCDSTEFKGWLTVKGAISFDLYYTPCMELELDKVDFCSFPTPQQLIVHSTIEMNEQTKIVAYFEHDIGILKIYVCKEGGDWFQIAINYEDLRECIIQNIGDDNKVKLVLPYRCIPSFWTAKEDVIKKKRDKLRKDFQDKNRLETQIRLKADWSRSVSLDKDRNVPYCSAMVLTYDVDSISQIVTGFKKHAFECYFSPITMKHTRQYDYDSSWIDNVMGANPRYTDHINLRYSLKCLESVGYQFIDKKDLPGQDNESFIEHVCIEIKRCEDNFLQYIIDALHKIAHAFEKNPFINLIKSFDKHHEQEKRRRRTESQGAHYKYIKRVIVTPSRIIFVPPEPVVINRILRQNIEYLDNFMRVCFRDEDFSAFNVGSEEGKRCVSDVIETGIQMDDLVFEFLGCSNSQLRSQGLWMFYPQAHKTVESIRASIGDLHKMKTVQKFVTRMGLAFTATVFGLEDDVEEQLLPEVSVIRNRYKMVFSDGVGCISPSVAKQITTYPMFSDTDYTPCAYQIRYGGCKGMVSVNPLLEGQHVIQIRPSMKKFESEHKRVEICNYSAPRELHMNRQVIGILRALGVPDRSFITLQNKSLMELADMLLLENAAAGRMESRLGIQSSELRSSGVKVTTEPYLRSQLLSFYKFYIREALWKTRFQIDIDKGRQMRGVMDETMTLDYGQVFVQYTDIATGQRIIYKGELFVAKNPCLHPGDIRTLEGVDVPGLSHLYDVIVFPARGQRPHPNEMSGSDLDGDEYFVCWDETLFPKRNYPPAKYYLEEIPEGESDPPPAAGDFTDEKINEFVYEYITKGPKLGQISNAHTVWADRKEKGVLDEQCLKLAQSHSDAVDFVKTGIAPKFDYNDRSKIFPDWLMKFDKAAYESDTAVGQMFHTASRLHQTVGHLWQGSLVAESDIAPAMIFELDEHPTNEEADKARKLSDAYCTELLDIMVAYGIEEEGDIAAGCLNSLKLSLAKEHERNYEMREQCNGLFRALQQKYRKIFFKDLGVTEQNWKSKKDAAFRQIAAWYHITYNKAPLHSGMRLLSFPWCLPDVLVHITSVTSGSSQSCKGELKQNFIRWYKVHVDQRGRLREGAEGLKNLVRKYNLQDISRHTFGVPSSTQVVLYAKSMREVLSLKGRVVMMKSIQNVYMYGRGEDRYLKMTHTLNTVTYDVIVTADKAWYKRALILQNYSWKNVRIRSPFYAVLNWSDKNGFTFSDVEIGMLFLEFILQNYRDIKLINDVDEPKSILLVEEMRKDPIFMYQHFLRWVINGDFEKIKPKLRGDPSKTIRKVFSQEKYMIAAMQEYHEICFTLKLDNRSQYSRMSILKKCDKRSCYNIARATSFCCQYLNNIRSEGDNTIEVKLRETYLGQVSTIVLEVWGKSPQIMADIGHNLKVDCNLFELQGDFLKIKDLNYPQYIHLCTKTEQTKKKFFMVKETIGSKLEEILVNCLSIRTTKHVVLAFREEMVARVTAMREKLYNSISHGTVSIVTYFGDTSKVFNFTTGGKCSKRRVKFDIKIKNSIMKKVKSIFSTMEHRITYTYKVVNEGLVYYVKFDENQDPLSLSLPYTLWGDLTIDDKVGLNSVITSAHTLGEDGMKEVPFTASLFEGVRWNSNETELASASANIPTQGTVAKIGQIKNQTSGPCVNLSEHAPYVLSVQRDETITFTLKDPTLKGMTVQHTKSTLSSFKNKGYDETVNFERVSLAAKDVDLDDSDYITHYLDLTVQLKTPTKLGDRGRPRRPQDMSNYTVVPRGTYLDVETVE